MDNQQPSNPIIQENSYFYKSYYNSVSGCQLKNVLLENKNII